MGMDDARRLVLLIILALVGQVAFAIVMYTLFCRCRS